MHDVAAGDARRHLEVDAEGLQREVRAGQGARHLVGDRALARAAEAVDVDVLRTPQLLDQEVDVHPCAAVDVGRELSRQQGDPHGHSVGCGHGEAEASSGSSWPAARASD